MNANAQSGLSNSDKKKLFVLEKLNDEWELMPKKLTPKLLKLHWSKYESWYLNGGIDGYSQLNNVLLSLQEEGLIIGHKWINPAR